MHRLSRLRIQNFRACKDVSLRLEDYTPLVGQNNTGKSTILDAIRWVLRPSVPPRSDYHDPEKPVEVTACIEGITEELLDRLPEPKHREAIRPFCPAGKLWIYNAVSGTGKKSVVQKIWDIEQYRGEEEPEHWRDYPTGLSQGVSALLPVPLVVAAMDDVGEDLGKGKPKAGTTIKNLLDEIMESLLATHAELNEALGMIRAVLSVTGDQRSEHLRQFDTDATEVLQDFFPGLGLDLDLQGVDLKEFFKDGDLHVTDNATKDRRRFDQMGTGAQRSIQMALIRYLAETRAGKGGGPTSRLLLVDEPELYLHPQGVRRLRQSLANLAKTGFQVVFSTHSPLMLSRDNAGDTVIVTKSPEAGVTARKPLQQAVEEALGEAKSQSRTLFELSNLVEIYFAERVVLCEGKTDRHLLPLAYERLYGHPPDLDHITFVPLGSCGDIPKALKVLEAMSIRVCAVADLDFAFTHAAKGGLLAEVPNLETEARQILARLQPEHGFKLNGNGLPQRDGKAGWSAAEVWAWFATDPDGKAVVKASHEALKREGVWVWPQGCIEDVTKTDAKGEDAIIAQEQQLLGLNPEELAAAMPAFQQCFEWIQSL